MLVVRVSARFGQLHAGVHQLFDDLVLGSMDVIRHLLQRARLFRYVLTPSTPAAPTSPWAGLRA